MKLVILACIIAVAVADHPYRYRYVDRFDNINLEDLLGDNGEMRRYVACAAGRGGRCSSEWKDLRDRIEDAVAADCDRCSDSQRYRYQKNVENLIKRRVFFMDVLRI